MLRIDLRFNLRDDSCIVFMSSRLLLLFSVFDLLLNGALLWVVMLARWLEFRLVRVKISSVSGLTDEREDCRWLRVERSVCLILLLIYPPPASN